MIKHLFSKILSACVAVVIVAACDVTAMKEDSHIPEEGEDPAAVTERATIPFSLTVNTLNTKVSYGEGTFSFKQGDKLHVVGVDRTDVEGDLSQGSDGKWSGYLSYDVSEGEPDADTRLAITLIHADNDDDSSYASALIGDVTVGSTALKEAVEKYSLFTANTTLSSKSVTLYQQATFLDVTVTFDFDGSCSIGGGKALLDLATTRGKASGETTFVALTNGEDFEVHFMAVVPGDQTVSAFTLTVGDRKIEFSDSGKVLERNNRYTINRTVVYRPQLGDPFWSDGTYGRLRPADPDTRIIGIIVYVNHNYENQDKAAIDEAITEKDAGFGHGLVMALNNVSTEGVKWCDKDKTGIQCTSPFVTNPKGTIAAGNLSGYSNTNSIIAALGEGTSAASKAKAYAVSVPSGKTTGWFLPSIGQWIYSISTEGFGGANPAEEWINTQWANWLEYGNITGNLVCVMECDEDKVNLLIRSLNRRLELLAQDFADHNLTYDSFGDPSEAGNISDNYWSSSEYSANNAIRMNFGTVEERKAMGKWYSTIKIRGESKNITSYPYNGVNYKMKVRPFLAF